jgi:hypothetical protein
VGLLNPLSDDEVRALGYEPTPEGWVPLFSRVEARLKDSEWHLKNGYMKPHAGCILWEEN